MIPNPILALYFDRMVGRVYKILPLKESGEATLPEYLDTLVTEMTGLDVLSALSDQPYYTSMFATLAYLSGHIDECDLPKVKREVFRLINLSKKLRSYYEGGGYSGCS